MVIAIGPAGLVPAAKLFVDPMFVTISPPKLTRT